jgi:hypothetical protein
VAALLKIAAVVLDLNLHQLQYLADPPRRRQSTRPFFTAGTEKQNLETQSGMGCDPTPKR